MDDTVSLAHRARLFAALDGLGLQHRTVEHPPIMTVDEGRALKGDMPGGHSKNLFLKDKQGAYFLVCAHCDSAVALTPLARAIGARGRLSFGRPEAMESLLGVRPGAVTPFGLINAPPAAFSAVVLDRRFLDFERIWFHPLDNAASTAVTPDGLLAFLHAQGYDPVVLDVAAPGEGA